MTEDLEASSKEPLLPSKEMFDSGCAAGPNTSTVTPTFPSVDEEQLLNEEQKLSPQIVKDLKNE